MTTTVHKNLTGADLHEPKGAAAAASGQVYVSDGAGSGVWTTTSSIVTAGGFTTGNTKFSYGGVETGWILADDGSIGDGSSSATNRANSDTSALYVVLWAVASTTVSGGKGVSAAADFAAHKPLTLPPSCGRAVGISGSGSGLTSRAIGFSVGEETHILSASEIPSITSSNSSTQSGSASVVSTVSTWQINTAGTYNGNSGGSIGTPQANNGAVSSTGSASFTAGQIAVQSTNTGGGGHNNMQPTAFLNMLIKL